MIRTVWAPMAMSLVFLSGCSSTPSTPKVNKLHQEVSQLNQQMQHLTSQASALEIQGQLNSHSQQGAWLVPQANTPVELQTQLGTLRLSLSRVEGEANGSRANLNIRATGDQPIPLCAPRLSGVSWIRLAENRSTLTALIKPLTCQPRCCRKRRLACHCV